MYAHICMRIFQAQGTHMFIIKNLQKKRRKNRKKRKLLA